MTIPAGAQSDLAKVKVDLPKQLPSRLTTLQKACQSSTFNANPAECPPGALIGAVKIITPILPVPLVGPVYFVSHGGGAYPDLVIVVEGYGVRVDVVGHTSISTKAITSTSFTSIPDFPFNSFEIYLPQGPDSALAAGTKLCSTKLLMPTIFTAQDGVQLKRNIKMTVSGCAKAKSGKAAARASGRRTSHTGRPR